MTAPHPRALGAIRSMQSAMSAAGLEPGDVDYVCAHGTGTPINDAVEAEAIAAVFGDYAVPVSSIKSSLGHCQGAAAAMEAVSCLLAIRDGVLPPTVNLRVPDARCRVDVVANEPRALRVDVAINNAFGFGGNNCSVAFTSVDKGDQLQACRR